MRAIADLEDSPRGVYTGAVGWLAPPGAPGPRARFNVAIRTVVIDAERGCAEFGVGGGVTWDSSPEGEYDECRAKALVLTTRRPSFDLLEVIRWEPDAGFVRLPDHLQRLAGSAAYFGFEHDERRVLATVLEAAAGATGPVRIRVVLSPDGSVRTERAPALPASEEPVRLAVHDAEPVDPTDPFLFHKTTSREVYRRARDAHPEADDVILVNDRGQVTEATIANVAVRLEGAWWTPPLDAGCLPGVYRSELVGDGTLRERPITLEDLRAADALALVSSVRGWRAATLVPVPSSTAPAGR